ncbi:hypothetical protein FRX31_014745 [Thalictrum thalictroides]|uniref:DDE Tnp4 domain-containing protein n=1 Tax=Thalictrum thalictroides TaxID=46969 RepID=A0A7J6WFJ3_THATH|nr:hypothetical protein FRX31_014745 [Thalictrum thalictroides]
MPQESSKQKFLADARDALAVCDAYGKDLAALSSDLGAPMDSTYDEDKDFEVAGILLRAAIAKVEPRRYIVGRTKIQRSQDFVNNYFMDQPDHEFRMSQNSLLQLAVALERFGSYGNGASLGRIARTYGIGEGTVHTYTKRVITAVRALRGKYIAWPDADRRRQTSAVMSREGFNGCVGFVDGTTIPLFQRPGIDGEVYWDRKSRYSLNTQVVCDCDKKIIFAYTGCPGSMADASVFRRMDISKEPANFFSNGEYLIGDSAYGLSNHMITPFKSPATNLPENQVFNKFLAKSRVRNEHTIGILKGRWASLNELRIAINKREDAEHAVGWIMTCCLLHNMLADLG